MALAFVGLMSFNLLATHVLAYILFVAATITDYYDGKIARSRNLVTNFGKLLDPVADKVLLVGALIMLMGVPELHIPSWTVVVILAREFLITGARSLAASDGVVISANIWGKTKAVIQMVYVFVFLFLAVTEEALRSLAPSHPDIAAALPLYRDILAVSSTAAIVFVAVFTMYSGVQFMYSNWRVLNLGK